MPITKIITKGKVPVKIYTDDIEHQAYQQLANLSELPFIHSHIAAMPDVYFGRGALGNMKCHEQKPGQRDYPVFA